MAAILLIGLLSGAGLIVLTGLIYYFLSVRHVQETLTDLEQHSQVPVAAATSAIATPVTTKGLERKDTQLFPDLPTAVVDDFPNRK